MITVYTGTPGSGKSLRAARKIQDMLAMHKKDVIANFPINLKQVSKNGKKKIGKFTYLRNDHLTVEFLIKYAKKRHKVGKEGQTLIVIDEAGIMFNSRDYGAFDRKSWINFFMTHRHYGYDVLLIAQHDRLIDRQIRAFLEYDIKHRKINNYRMVGLLLTILRVQTFTAITFWYGMSGPDARCSGEFFRFRKKDAHLYDTMAMFEEHSFADDEDANAAAADGGLATQEQGGPIVGGGIRVTMSFYKKKLLHTIAHSYVPNKGGYALIGHELLAT